MPGQPFYSPTGYVALVHASLSATDTKLDLNNISCGGESAESMINGSQLPTVASSCGPPEFYQNHFPHKTQLAEAVNFLHAHKEKVDLVTITIGANDLAPCSGTRDLACYGVVFQSMAQDLGQILDTLQAAAPSVRIVGMTYHNPTACLLPVDPGSAGFLQQVVLGLNATLARCL